VQPIGPLLRTHGRTYFEALEIISILDIEILPLKRVQKVLHDVKVEVGRFLLTNRKFALHLPLPLVTLIISVKTAKHVEAGLNKEEVQKSQLPQNILRVLLSVEVLTDGLDVARVQHDQQLSVAVFADLFKSMVLCGVVCNFEHLHHGLRLLEEVNLEYFLEFGLG